ncbi:PREDICTED: geranylgeranyl transferase type-2 subunit alpha isoform X2 [Rhagoletis zephyria]|uniref:geranylgeranyl transferase type-2 subunit alpha isoform X2 n=1 Tax=Rhagoletis zephyria TaxID=28612 RepID=UPI0008116509|nr:PREDICTED: geranylgeranyl transferase type-2 subunit alpha isoform X2 [Rhagoletis zephyria]XP_036341966.1 geranylgeranyl transferase type-2 subunit alpha isoform X2 [Rhagoletis pomonella]
MHGRLKVRTTEEERERKKKEQALKVKAYNSTMSKIQDKRRRKELDDEMLQLTSQILLRNPDVTTLWNIRRECVEKKTNLDQKNGVYDAELNFSEQCLLVNPKSYNGWHHRCWILEHSPNANWEREVQLCSKYLKMDERNFHTWDYRRYVAVRAQVSRQNELDFCTEKIKANFSNYSSWHHRSLLLPILYPYKGDTPKQAMSESKLREELEMVLTAAFTDPKDSSAWFYQRWLLGYSRQELDVCAFRHDNNHAVIAFTNPIILVFTGSILNELQSQLESCQSLLEYEPDSKWTLLTSALLMRAIDPQRYHDKSLQILATLQKVDALRKNYYLDMSSKWILEKGLSDWADSQDVPKTLDLRHEERLNALFYQQYFCIVDNVLLPENLNHCINEVKNLIHTSYSLVVFILVRIQ